MAKKREGLKGGAERCRGIQEALAEEVSGEEGGGRRMEVE
jgi:hypothetical protein